MGSKVQQLQLLQQNLQSVATQKQNIQNQLIELESALEGLKSAKSSYRIIGKIMVAAPPGEIGRELQQKKELQLLRLKNFSSQEDSFQKSIHSLQKELVEELQQEKMLHGRKHEEVKRKEGELGEGKHHEGKDGRKKTFRGEA